MTHDEMIAVIQAHIDGKQIQTKTFLGHWCTTVLPDWDFLRCEYRVKPELREWWVTIDGGVRIHADKSAANHAARHGAKIIKVREILSGERK